MFSKNIAEFISEYHKLLDILFRDLIYFLIFGYKKNLTIFEFKEK